MSVLISGSLAYDTVFVHEGHFCDTLLAETLSCLNVTFQAQSMRKTLGGCAGNIAYSLKQLGGDPLIWTAVGGDADPYLAHLSAQGIRTEAITVVPETYTAQAVITTDSHGCQLTTFHSGAMEYAAGLPFPQGTIDLAILAPTTHEPLLAHAKALHARSIPFLLDTGQTTPLFSGEELLTLMRQAIGVCFSEYEAELYCEKTGLRLADLAQLSTLYITAGSRGSDVWHQGVVTHIAAQTTTAIDPVGAGDAHRGGLLWGLSHGLTPIESARLGSLIAARKVSVAGPAYHYSLNEARLDWQDLYGTPPERLR